MPKRDASVGFEKYAYVSDDGNYEVRQWLDDAGIIHQQKSGYATAADAQAETERMAALVEAHQLRGTLYVAVDMSQLEGVARAGRKVYADRLSDSEHQWVIAGHGANAVTRVLGRIFQTLRPSMKIRLFKTESDAVDFLSKEMANTMRPDKGGEVLSSPARSLKDLETEYPNGRKTITEDGESVSALSPAHWSYESQSSSLSVTYHLLSDDVVLIKVKGALETEEQLHKASRVAESVYEEIGAESIYVIRDSREVDRVSLAGRRAYMEYVKKSSSRERLVVHIGSTLSAVLLRSIRVLAPKTFGEWVSARGLFDALKTVKAHRESLDMTHGESHRSPTHVGTSLEPLDVDFVTQFVDRLVSMGWDVHHEPEELNLPKNHPFQDLVVTLNLLQRDLKESFELQESQLDALRASQEILSQAHELAHLGSWEWTPDTGGMHWSTEAFQMFGYEPFEVVPSYQLFLEHLHPDTSEHTVKSMTNALVSGGRFGGQVVIEQRGGDLRVCRLRGRVENDPQTNRLLVRATFLDVTDLTHAKQEAERANLVLEESHAGLKEHLAALSHDVRTPLTSLKLGLSRLVDSQLPENLGAALRAEVEHLDTLFANMLSLTRLKVIGVEKTMATPCDLSDLMERIRTRLSLLAQDQGVQINISHPVDHLVAFVDELAMEQAATNLVHNAVKFAHENVSILLEDHQAQAVIRIRDDGPMGRPNLDEKSRLISSSQPFFITESGKGLGLGFAIANTIVTNHGGEITVNQNENIGTEVTLVIPKNLNQSAEDDGS